MSPAAWSTSTRTVPTDWHRRKNRCLRDHARICHRCAHGEAEQVDHVINVARGGDHGPGNLRPAHGAPCPTCGRKCHQIKTQAEALAGRQRHKARRPAEPHPGLKQPNRPKA